MNPRSITGRAVGIGVLCVAAMAVCLGLAWWQWDRFSSAGGTFQNLGYVLQWPLFGLFPAFMVWRWRVLQRRRTTEPEPTAAPANPGADAVGAVGAAGGTDAAEPGRPEAAEPAPRTARTAGARTPGRTGERVGEARPAADTPGASKARSRVRLRGGPGPGAGEDAEDPEDAELAAYNRYLAELNARDQEVN